MITRDNIVELAEQELDVGISIFLPTHRKGDEIQQDSIRLKNLLSEAENQLKERKISDKRIDKLLGEPRKLLEQASFWRHNDKGLAFFISEEDFNYFRIPYGFKEQVMVSDHYLITPLIPMITLEGTFCTLALSQKNIRLLKCTRDSAELIALEDSPTSLDEYLKYDVNEKHLQHHAGAGAGSAIFHGHGGAGETDMHEIINYLKTVENEVTSIMKKRNDPLILAGVERAVAEYRKFNHYSRLIDQAIHENPDPLSDKEVGERSWEIIRGYFLQDMYNDMDRFADLSGSEKQSDNLSKIVEAAYYGKVDSLFVPIGEHSWGWFDQDRDVVHHSATPKNGEHDLINMAAIKTLTQSGNVYALEKNEMPNSSSIAAIFRYA